MYLTGTCGLSSSDLCPASCHLVGPEQRKPETTRCKPQAPGRPARPSPAGRTPLLACPSQSRGGREGKGQQGRRHLCLPRFSPLANALATPTNTHCARNLHRAPHPQDWSSGSPPGHPRTLRPPWRAGAPATLSLVEGLRANKPQ